MIGEINTCVPFCVHWLVIPGGDDKLCFRQTSPTRGPLAIETGQGNDFLITGEGGLARRVGEFTSDAELALVRQPAMGGSFERILLINGSSLRNSSKNILSASQKFARFSAARVKDSLDIEADPEQPFRLCCGAVTRTCINGRDLLADFSGGQLNFRENN